MENHMEEVAKMLGVKLGERFRTDDGDELYSIDNDGCWCYCPSKQSDLDTLALLLIGKCTIKKLPWKPKLGNNYWFINSGGHIIKDNWSGGIVDLAMYYAGDCFETYGEAEAHAPEIIEKMKSFYENRNR